MIQPDLTPSLPLLAAIGALIAGGVYLMLERSLTRILLGFIMVGNGINLVILVAGGRSGAAPILDGSDAPMADPLAQAMVLTSIVITLAMTGFVAALAYRSWQLQGHDEVQDDVEDRRIARLAGSRTHSDFAGVWLLDDDAAASDDEIREAP